MYVQKIRTQRHTDTQPAAISSAGARAIGVARHTTALPLSDLLLYMVMTLFQKQHTLMFFFPFVLFICSLRMRDYKCYVFETNTFTENIYSCRQPTHLLQFVQL